MTTLEQRIRVLMEAKSWRVGDVATVAGVSSSAVSQWLGNGKTTKQISNVSAALRLAQESGFSAVWIAEGTGPEKLPAASEGAPWPFELIDRQRYDALAPSQRFTAQAAMLRVIEESEAASGKRRQAQQAAPQSIASPEQEPPLGRGSYQARAA